MNFDANTISEAVDYMIIRNQEFSSIGITPSRRLSWDDEAIITIYDELYIAIYILKDYRNKGLYKKILNAYRFPVITMEDCNIESYLKKINHSYIVVKPSNCYLRIKEFYGNDKSKRSKVPLMNHINEGLVELNKLNASQNTLNAYCLHPIFQSNENFLLNYLKDYKGIDITAIILALEYRRVANSYLSSGKKEDFVGFTSLEIRQMLYADKIQNERDFRFYHENTHKNSKRLREYFNDWFDLLEIT